MAMPRKGRADDNRSGQHRTERSNSQYVPIMLGTDEDPPDNTQDDDIPFTFLNHRPLRHGRIARRKPGGGRISPPRAAVRGNGWTAQPLWIRHTIDFPGPFLRYFLHATVIRKTSAAPTVGF